MRPVGFLILLGFFISLTPWITSPIALSLGLILALVFGNPYQAKTRKLIKPMLAYSITGLGAGMNLLAVARAGLDGALYTVAGLSFAMLLGWLLARLLKTPSMLALLINVGTAICGGSAIAAVSSAIGSDEDDTSLALAVVFILNALGLLLFPLIGHSLNMTQPQFGLWSALSIHDTSSVVAANLQFGTEALQLGTTVKLVRSLWIIPVTMLIAFFYQRRKNKTSTSSKPQYPKFILGFIAMSALITFVPELASAGQSIEFLAKRLLTATLFLIGCGLTLSALKKVGLRPLLHGVLLWIVVATVNLLIILNA